MKKTTLISIILFIIFFLIVALIFVFWFKTRKDIPTPLPAPQVISNTMKIQNCDPFLDVGTAIKTGDVKGCDCLTDISQRKLCQGQISDGTLYTKALADSDVTVCSKISQPDMRNVCAKTVQGKIDFEAKNLKASSIKQ